MTTNQKAINDAISDSLARFGIDATVTSIIHQCEYGVVVHSVTVLDANNTTVSVDVPTRQGAQDSAKAALSASAEFLYELFSEIDWQDMEAEPGNDRKAADYRAACDFFTGQE
jgi:hypothetical protein